MVILHLMGYLGADPEMRYTPGGQKVWNLRLATRSRKGAQEETIWWRITVWGDQYDKMLGYFSKGKPIYIIAEMNKLETYTDKNGTAQISYEATARSLHFAPFSGEGNKPEGNSKVDSRPQEQEAFEPASSLSGVHNFGGSSFDEDEPIPF
jgi:single-strand DNA-binding protein